MGDPVTLVESTKPPVFTTENEDGAKPHVANKNGKKSDSGSGSGSFFTWFMVLALLGVWTSVAVVYFDLVDYQGVLGKLVAYDTDGDGDFDVEDAKVLLDEKPGEVSRKGAKKENPLTKDVGWKLREALKQQLAIIHERVEAKKIAKLALVEVRQLLAKEEEEKAFELRRDELSARVRERVAVRLKEEEEKIEREEMEKALEKRRREKAEQQENTMDEETEEEKVGEKKSKKGGEKEKKADGEGRKAEEDKGKGKEFVKEKGKRKEFVKEKGKKSDKADRKLSSG